MLGATLQEEKTGGSLGRHPGEIPVATLDLSHEK
jgi:hypothetical protein